MPPPGPLFTARKYGHKFASYRNDEKQPNEIQPICGGHSLLGISSSRRPLYLRRQWACHFRQHCTCVCVWKLNEPRPATTRMALAVALARVILGMDMAPVPLLPERLEPGGILCLPGPGAFPCLLDHRAPPPATGI